LEAIAASGKYLILDAKEPYEDIDADGLVLNLDASKLSSYPATGSNWYDLSGDGNTGVLTNGPVFSDGVFTFDGTNDKVLCGNSSSLDFGANEPFTVCSLVKHTVNNSGYDVYAAKHSSTTGWISNLRWNSGVHQLRWWVNGQVSVTYTPTKPYLNRWRYVCMQIDDSFIGSIFEDGIKVASGSVSTNSPSNVGQVQIGNDDFNSAFKGEMSLTQLYNKALTETQVKQNYYGGNIVTDGLVFAVDASKLVSYESGSTTAYSMTGSLTGSLVNSVGFDKENGGSWDFDGTDDYIHVSGSSDLRFGTGGFCVSAWVYPTATDNVRIVNDRGTGGFNYPGYQFKMEQASGNWYFSDCAVRDGVAQNQYNNSGTQYPLNQWYYVTMNYVPQTRVEYYVNTEVDGIDTSNIPQSSIDNSLPTAIGAAVSANGIEGTTSQFFGGKIALVQIYNRELTQNEIAQNYNATKQRYVK
jgi:hypothetical protein